MGSAERWRAGAIAAVIFAALTAAPTSARAETGPARVAVTLVGHAQDDPALFERIRSLFARKAQVELAKESRLDSGQVLEPEAPDTVYLWITLSGDGKARVYVAAREDTEQVGARYLYRDIALDSGLDEVGSETVAQIAHSSANALWAREQITSKPEFVAQLEANPITVSEPLAMTRPLAPSPRVPGLVAPTSLDRGTKASASSSLASNPFAFGVAYGAHASGAEGWLQEPSAFAELIYRERFAFRIAGNYLIPTEFEVSPTQVRLSGGGAEVRAGWIPVPRSQPRFRFDGGLGLLLARWSSSIVAQDPPAQAQPSESLQRAYAVLAGSLEWPLGPLRMAARAELRLPFRQTTYEVLGEDHPAERSWLNPGAALEIAVPFGTAERSRRQR